MGTICAPNYPNISMEKFEKTDIYPNINSFSNFSYRFIDDIFFLQNEIVVQLQEFIKKPNKCHPAINFDFKFSKTSIDFLDGIVHKNKKQHKLLTTVRTVANQQIEEIFHTSTHLGSLINSIPYSQTLRLKKSCAETSELKICNC